MAVELLYSTTDKFRQMPATQKNKDHIRGLIAKSNEFEDILIRVVLRGEKLDDVLKKNYPK